MLGKSPEWFTTFIHCRAAAPQPVRESQERSNRGTWTSTCWLKRQISHHMMSKASLAAARVVLVGAAAASLFFVRTLQPSTTGAVIFFSVWLLLPYVALMVVVEKSAGKATATADFVTTCLVAGGALAFLTLVIFVDPDPQGGIAVLFTPVYQGIAMMILFPLVRWAFRR